MEQKKYLWMKTTKDKYEFPLRICDTAVELAKECNISVSTIRSQVCRGRKGWAKVEVIDDDYTVPEEVEDDYLEEERYIAEMDLKAIAGLLDGIKDMDTFEMIFDALAELYDKIKEGGKNGQD